MASDIPLAKVPATPAIPLTVGILNVLFAVVLLLCTIGNLAYQVLLIPQMERGLAEAQQKMREHEVNRRKVALEELDVEEKEAQDEATKQEVRDRRKTLESEPVAEAPTLPSAKSLGLTSPKFRVFTWTEFGTAGFVNILMLAAGIGLIQRKEWGRRLANWVSVGKVLRLFVVWGFFAAVLAPEVGRRLTNTLYETMAQQQKAIGRPITALPPKQYLNRVYTIALSATGVAMIVFGSVYPAISLILLTRPGVKVACSPAVKTQELDLS